MDQLFKVTFHSNKFIQGDSLPDSDSIVCLFLLHYAREATDSSVLLFIPGMVKMMKIIIIITKFIDRPSTLLLPQRYYHQYIPIFDFAVTLKVTIIIERSYNRFIT